MLRVLYTLFLFLAYISNYAHTARILGIYLIGCRSTFMLEQQTIKVLLERGHEVYVISKFVQNPKIYNYTDIDVSEDIVGFDGTVAVGEFDHTVWNMLQFAFEVQRANCDRLFKNKKMLNLISSQTFDLVIVEMDGTECILPVAFSFGAPVVGVYTNLLPFTDLDRLLGNSVNPSFLPSSLGGYSIKLNFFERLNSFIQYLAHFVLRFRYAVGDTKMARQILPDSPSIPQLVNNISLVFANNFAGFLPRALPPNTIPISGIHIKDTDPLPKDIKNFIDRFKNGIIYVSFGSTVKFSSLRTEIHNAFLKVLSSLPYGILWKHDNPETINKVSDNILAKKWFSQSDILGESNVVLFISHCGLLGVYESINGGKPILCLPVFYDQMTNAAFVKKLELGSRLDFSQVDENSLRNSVNALLNNKYRENARHFSHIFKDRLASPADTFAYWIEYAIRYKGAPHLKPVGHELYFFQYLLLDVLAFCIMTAAVVFSIFRYIFKLITLLCKNPKKSKKN